MQEAEIRRTEHIDSAEQKDLDDVSHRKFEVRARAIAALTEGLDLNTEEGRFIKLTIPLEFIARDDIMRAIWYIETVGKSQGNISIDITKSVCREAIDCIYGCTEWGDDEGKGDIEKAMRSLFRMIMERPDLMNDPQVFIMMGNFEEALGDYERALAHYAAGIEKKDVISYIESARVYADLGNSEKSIATLKDGFEVSKDARILGPLIHMLCKIHHRNEAMNYYGKLQEIEEGHVPPFIVYRGTIENDEDLEKLSGAIASYFTEGNIYPSEALARISHVATAYISSCVEKENKILLQLKNKGIRNCTKEEHERFTSSVFRRLKLIQIDILTLCNSRYVSQYIQQLEQYWIDGSDGEKYLLGKFFDDNFSEEVRHHLDERDVIIEGADENPEGGSLEGATKEPPASGDSDQGDEEGPDIGSKNNQDTPWNDLFFHVSRVGEIFSQSEFYDIHKHQIVPMMLELIKDKKDFDFDKSELGLLNRLSNMSSMVNFYDDLDVSIRENYENFISRFDKKYGVFFRRRLQIMAMDDTLTPDEYPGALANFPDIALLFWIEKIIADQFTIDDYDEIYELMRSYGLDRLDIQNALLFGSFIKEISIPFSVAFLADYPNMLEVPEAIYIISEGLRRMDGKSRKNHIKELHAIAKSQYGARGFFDHVRLTFADILNNNPDDDDRERILLASGSISTIQDTKTRTQAQATSIINFQSAASEYHSLDGLLQLGDSAMEKGEYDNAMGYYLRALEQHDTIGLVTKILRCTILSGNYDQTEKYITLAIENEYNIANYILALHLWQGKVEPAILQMIAMIQGGIEFVDMPEGLMQKLTDTIDYVIRLPDTHETYKLKIYASYVSCNLVKNSKPPKLTSYLRHWDDIDSLTDLYEGDELHEVIKDVLLPLTGDIEDNLIKNRHPSDISIGYINHYASLILVKYGSLMEDKEDERKVKRIRMLMSGFMGRVILTLSKFPDSEDIVAEWRKKYQALMLDKMSIGDIKSANPFVKFVQ